MEPGEKPRRPTKSVSLPVDLVERHERAFERFGRLLGYPNVTAFIEEGARRWVELEEERGMTLERAYQEKAPAPPEPRRRRQA